MLKIEDREWKDFFIEEVAEINSGRDIYEAERISGNTPYVSSSSVNNGICHFISNTNETLESNCISVNRNGSVGYAFYHPYKALYSNDCRKLRPKQQNKYVAIFIAIQITAQKNKYSYGYKMGTGRLKRQKIMLPIDNDGKPDYVFMEQYIKERELQIVQKYIKYIGNIAQNGGVIQSLDSRDWKEFYLHEIFTTIQRGKRLKTADHINGNIPYVSSSAMNNGVDNFIGNDGKVRKFNDCLTLANSGSVGTTFYHSYEFIASDHVTELKSSRLNKYSYLFIAAIVQRLEEKYSFNREINDTRINKEKILLPVDENGNPDYDFMEQYAKHIMNELKLQYLQHKQAESA